MSNEVHAKSKSILYRHATLQCRRIHLLMCVCQFRSFSASQIQIWSTCPLSRTNDGGSSLKMSIHFESQNIEIHNLNFCFILKCSQMQYWAIVWYTHSKYWSIFWIYGFKLQNIHRKLTISVTIWENVGALCLFVLCKCRYIRVSWLWSSLTITLKSHLAHSSHQTSWLIVLFAIDRWVKGQKSN